MTRYPRLLLIGSAPPALLALALIGGRAGMSSPSPGDTGIPARNTMTNHGAADASATGTRLASRPRLAETPGIEQLLRHFAAGEPERILNRLQKLAESDPEAAYRLAVALGGHEGASELAREALRILVSRDVEAAIRWGESLPDSPEFDLFRAAVVDVVAGADPGLAFTWANATRGDLRLELLENVFAEWADADTPTARREAAALPDGDARLVSHLALMSAGIERDPRHTIDWIESIGDPQLQDALYYHSVAKWASMDPVGAAEFVHGLAQADYKTHVAGDLSGTWARMDPEAAVAWSSLLVDQESREQAISSAMRQIMETSTEQAGNLALRIPGEGDRHAAIESVVSEWIGRDPVGLQRWTQEVGDPGVRESILQMIKDHQPHGGLRKPGD